MAISMTAMATTTRCLRHAGVDVVAVAVARADNANVGADDSDISTIIIRGGLGVVAVTWNRAPSCEPLLHVVRIGRRQRRQLLGGSGGDGGVLMIHVPSA